MQSQASEQAIELSPVSGRAVTLRRVRGVALLVPCAAVLAVAAWLTPSESGYGTHRQLGMPACSFVAETGYPCPSCGMTTAFSNMAHGRLVAAVEAQPFGAALFVVTAGLGAVGLGELLTGRDVIRYLRFGPLWAVATIVGIFAGWGIKIACGLAAGTLPVR